MLFLILYCIQGKAQCFNNYCISKNGEERIITGVLNVDNSLKFYQPSGFAGIGIHVGAWFRNIGLTVGGVDSKVGDKYKATRCAVVTLMTRIVILDDKIQTIGFIAAGTNNYQDIGIRTGYKVGKGIYAGVMTSFTMKYGLSLSANF